MIANGMALLYQVISSYCIVATYILEYITEKEVIMNDFSLYHYQFICILFPQILEFSHHVVAFVQTRGSVPLYWSQTGIKYRPPPRILKGESYVCFTLHVYRQVSNIRCTLVGNNIVDHSDVVGASPVGAAPTTSLFST